MAKLAIIGGTGVYNPGILKSTREQVIATPYGEALVTLGEYEGNEVAFLARHGRKHTVPPHRINYRANIYALKKLGVQQIVATTAVGSLNTAMAPGDFVLPDQFLDFTKQREHTFFDGENGRVVHIDVTTPYCGRLRDGVAACAKSFGYACHNGGVYVCTEGPRFETPAEINMFRTMGGDLVGMTNVPEVVLAREAEICYATLSIVTNFAAGMSDAPLTHKEVLDVMKESVGRFRNLTTAILDGLNGNVDCSCQHALHEFGGFSL